MPKNFSPVAENGRVSNGNTGFRIPKRSFSEMNDGSFPSGNQSVPETPAPQNTAPPPSPTPAIKVASAPVPVYNHGFVHDQGQSPPGPQDYFKCAEIKRAPSTTPLEPLKDLTPMQQLLETVLPETANFVVLPAKVTEKFSVGTCELCKVNMLSMIQTKMHYNGKPHLKKVKNFLKNECGVNDEPPVKIPKITKPEDDLKNEENRECKVCKVIFNSSVHANQHYEGKKHKKAMVNAARSGILADGRFGIGTGFSSASETKPIDSVPSISKPFFCELCNVQCSSSDQYKTHIEGARHNKNLRKVDPCAVTPNNHGANAKKFKQNNSKPKVTGFDLSEDEYVSKYEDY
ncbi:unnamed protein product [Bemisia tabaci]|uniref:C2H2-type domain-containing protein n=1 Tax=Bemisia tabaci TaxID=7038 RepID=A0A9P0C5P4_BEMTA|nr:PREDICTED: zinc finger protein 346-like isoform X2 [Bemisia tabaci]CAH0772463.1 unnamed protein product [Bemisia tabaci]